MPGYILGIVLGQSVGQDRQKWNKLLDNDRQGKTNYSWYSWMLIKHQRERDFNGKLIRKFHNKVEAGSKAPPVIYSS